MPSWIWRLDLRVIVMDRAVHHAKHRDRIHVFRRVRRHVERHAPLRHRRRVRRPRALAGHQRNGEVRRHRHLSAPHGQQASLGPRPRRSSLRRRRLAHAAPPHDVPCRCLHRGAARRVRFVHPLAAQPVAARDRFRLPREGGDDGREVGPPRLHLRDAVRAARRARAKRAPLLRELAAQVGGRSRHAEPRGRVELGRRGSDPPQHPRRLVSLLQQDGLPGNCGTKPHAEGAADEGPLVAERHRESHRQARSRPAAREPRLRPSLQPELPQLPIGARHERRRYAVGWSGDRAR